MMRRLLVVAAALGAALLILGLLQGNLSQARAQSEVPQATTQESPAPMAQAPTGNALRMQAFSLRHKKVDEVFALISPYLSPRGSVRMQPAQRSLTIQDAPENLSRIAALITAFDLPPRSVEVSVQLILASAGAGTQAPSPPPIRGVIDKLSALST